MSKVTDELKEALATATAIRAAAEANAMEAIEETITPHLQSMLAAKIEEMASEDESEVSEGTADEEVKEEEMPTAITEEEEDSEEETEETEEEESDDEESEEEAEEETEETEEEETIDFEDMPMEEFEAMVTDIVRSELEKGEEEAEEIEMELEDDTEEMEASTEEDSEEINPDDISLDELLAEIQEITDTAKEEVEEGTHEEGEEEAVNEFDLGYATNVAPELIAGVIAALGALGIGSMIDTKELKKMAPAKLKALAAKLGVGEKNEEVEEETHMEEELNEALETVKTLRNELSETNLLNAKLLYVNKLFKTNNLTTEQKVNTITAFDKADTVKEVKLVFETISEGLTKAARSSVSESKRFASDAAGTAPKTITENVEAPANSFKERMQVLAGIRKPNN